MNPNEIRKLREDTNLNQVKFGQLMGVSAAAVGYWERGERQPPPIYQANMMTLRDKLDNSTNKDEILNTIFKFIIIGGITAFLFWLYSKD